MESVKVVVPERFGFLAPNECALLRVGDSGDGGYVIGRQSMNRANALVSLGIATEWSFDSEFLRHRPRIQYLACDRGSGTLVHLVAAMRNALIGGNWRAARSSLSTAMRFFRHVPPWRRRRRFLRKWIRSGVNDPKRDYRWSDVLERLGVSTPIFVKMDIEGGEYELIPEMIRRESRHPGFFSGLSIEFHDIRVRESEFIASVSELLKFFAIVHVHANNCVALSSDFPDVLEITFAPRVDVSNTRIRTLPNTALDAPNDPNTPDYSLYFAD